MDIQDDVLIGISSSGYSNDELGYDWIKHFEMYSRKRQYGTHRLLLFDGHSSHMTREFLEFCDLHKIVPFRLPPHTTHLLQPLDVVVFQPYKHWHADAISNATRTRCRDFNKVAFLAALQSIREKTFKKSTIISAFRNTRLILLCPNIVLSKIEIASPVSRPVTPISQEVPVLQRKSWYCHFSSAVKTGSGRNSSF